MKPSRYNKTVWVEDEKKHLLFNGLSGALLKSDENHIDRINAILEGKINSSGLDPKGDDFKILSGLKKSLFLVPDDLDEIALLKTRFNITRFNDMHQMTIAPTLDCNLKCNYCFEKHLYQYMTDEVISQLKKYFHNWISRSKGKEVRVDWYGGEPLLALDTICDLSEYFQKACKENNCSYSATMVTNGTLLNSQNYKKLSKCDITGYQITLDGEKNTHDRRRPFRRKDEGSSYDTIVENIDYLIGRVPIYLRINVDNTNDSQVFDFLDTLIKKGWLSKDKRFHPYLASVGPYSQVCSTAAESCCSTSYFFDLSIKFLERLEKYDETIRANGFYLYPVTKKFNCSAISLNSITVGPTGAIYKCGLAIDDEKDSVGTIFDESFDIANPNMLNWLSFDPFSEERCKSCDLLPVCLGGCPKNIIEKDVSGGERNCQFMKNNFEKMIIFHGAE